MAQVVGAHRAARLRNAPELLQDYAVCLSYVPIFSNNAARMRNLWQMRSFAEKLWARWTVHRREQPAREERIGECFTRLAGIPLHLLEKCQLMVRTMQPP